MNKCKKLMALAIISSSILFSYVHLAEVAAVPGHSEEDFILSSLTKIIFDEILSIPTEKVSVEHRDLF